MYHIHTYTDPVNMPPFAMLVEVCECDICRPGQRACRGNLAYVCQGLSRLACKAYADVFSASIFEIFCTTLRRLWTPCPCLTRCVLHPRQCVLPIHPFLRHVGKNYRSASAASAVWARRRFHGRRGGSMLNKTTSGGSRETILPLDQVSLPVNLWHANARKKFILQSIIWTR